MLTEYELLKINMHGQLGHLGYQQESASKYVLPNNILLKKNKEKENI